MNKDTLTKAIKNIPDNGWYKSTAEDNFQRVGKLMVHKGFSVEDTVDILEILYSSVANCYGE